MNKILFLLLVIAAFACNNQRTFKRAEDAQDAGREFIRASLDGDYEKARYYLYADSTNEFLFDKWRQNYEKLPSVERTRYKDADIIVLDIHANNDSVTTFKYFNSYKKDTTTIKILRINGDWLVDLKEFMNPPK